VTNGSQLWGGQYNRPIADILAVQDEISNEIFEKLRGRITGEEKRRATRRYTDNADAYQLYLKGRFYWNQGTVAGLKQSIEYLQQAITTDPKYALAYAGLADSYLSLGSFWVEAISESKAAALKAIELDPTLAEAHVALGHIRLWLDWEWQAAELEFKQGIALNPNSALAHDQYAMYLAAMGRLDGAVSEARRAQTLDALSPIVNTDLGMVPAVCGPWQRSRRSVPQDAGDRSEVRVRALGARRVLRPTARVQGRRRGVEAGGDAVGREPAHLGSPGLRLRDWRHAGGCEGLARGVE
jgi:Flp pilus assembly protein TadD, contains TPR repeats